MTRVDGVLVDWTARQFDPRAQVPQVFTDPRLTGWTKRHTVPGDGKLEPAKT